MHYRSVSWKFPTKILHREIIAIASGSSHYGRVHTTDPWSSRIKAGYHHSPSMDGIAEEKRWRADGPVEHAPHRAKAPGMEIGLFRTDDNVHRMG